MKSWHLISALILGFFAYSSVATAQDDSRGRGEPGGRQRRDTPMFLLMDQQVIKELDIVPSQLKKLEEIRRRGQTGMREMFAEISALDDEQRQEKWKEIQAKLSEHRRALQEELNEILLPHQKDRLLQIYVQVRMRSGAGEALSDDYLAQELGITTAQSKELARVRDSAKAELQERIAEIRAEAEAKIAKAREEAEEKIMSVLTREQQAQLEKMRGRSFEFRQP